MISFKQFLIENKNLDDRSMPEDDEFDSGEYWFNPILIFEAAKEGKLKFIKTNISINDYITNNYNLKNKSKEYFLLHTNELTNFGDPNKLLKYVQKIKTGNINLPPVLMVETINNKILIDGNHRLIAAWLADINTIPAYVFKIHDLNSNMFGKN